MSKDYGDMLLSPQHNLHTKKKKFAGHQGYRKEKPSARQDHSKRCYFFFLWLPTDKQTFYGNPRPCPRPYWGKTNK